MRKAMIVSTLLAASLLLIIGCGSETDQPLRPSYASGTVEQIADAFATAMNENVDAYVNVYVPYGYDANRADPYPVLYLLHGFGGDENYFVNYFNVASIADKLIQEGVIDPIVIVMPNGKNAMGGSFYTNSSHPAVNTSEDHITQQVMAMVEGAYNVKATAAGRAIGGHSMGGYGALSIAMNNAGMFGAVAEMAGPISFWGTRTAPPHDVMDYKGIEELLPAILLETGYDPSTPDSAAWKAAMYPSPDRTVTSMMFAMAAAFSPTQFDPGTGMPIYVSTTIDSIIVDVDTTTTPPTITKQAMWVDLPLAFDGSLAMDVWTRWLGYDCLSRLQTQGVNIAPTSVQLFMDSGTADDLGLYGAQQVFAGGYQQAFGVAPSNDTYFNGISGVFGDIPAGHTELTYQRLELLLLWVDQQIN